MKDELIEYILTNKEKYYRIAYCYVKNEEDALDVVQDAIVKAFKYQSSLRETAYINTWFCKIVINTAKSHLQKQNRYINIDENQLESYEKPSYDHYKDFELEEALDHLSYMEKSIIMLRYFEEMDLKQVSTVMDQNLSTVKSTLYRALKKLRVILEKE